MKMPALLCALLVGICLPPAGRAESKAPAPYEMKPGSVDRACARSASNYAQVHLTNAGLLDQNKVDDNKTEALLLARKPIHPGMWESVYFMTLHQHDGKAISIITVSTHTEGECSVEDIKTYVVSRQLGTLPAQANLLKQVEHAPRK